MSGLAIRAKLDHYDHIRSIISVAGTVLNNGCYGDTRDEANKALVFSTKPGPKSTIDRRAEKFFCIVITTFAPEAVRTSPYLRILFSPT